MRVVLTQPAPRVTAVAARLVSLGHQALSLPGVRLVSLIEDLAAPVLAARLADADCVVMVSPGAIDTMLDRLDALGLVWPPGLVAAVVGPGSRDALVSRGLGPPRVPVLCPADPPYDSASLIALPAFSGRPPARVLVIAGEGGRTDWIDVLRGRGNPVTVMQVYRGDPLSVGPRDAHRLADWLGAPDPLVCLFTTGDAVHRLLSLVASPDARARLLASPALAIHPRITRLLSENGWTDVRQIDPGEAALASAIESVR